MLILQKKTVNLRSNDGSYSGDAHIATQSRLNQFPLYFLQRFISKDQFVYNLFSELIKIVIFKIPRP